MIWPITKKDFLLNLMTLKFIVCTILCVVLTMSFTIILISDYRQRLKDYDESIAANAAELRKVKVYKNIIPTIYRHPILLSVFNQGIEKEVSNSAKIELSSVPQINIATDEINPFLSIFPVLDITLIFKIVLSIQALLVAYDVISGEKEQGTLRLMLSGSVGRYHVLLAKVMAGLTTLVIPITVAFVAVLLILLLYPMVDLSGSDWARIGLMYLASLIFVSAMYNLGLLLSCLTKKSAISLLFVLLFWIIFLVIIPNVGSHFATQIHPLRSKEYIDGQIKSLWGEYDKELKQYNKNNPVSGNSTQAIGAFLRGYELACDEQFMKTHQKRYMFEEPLKIRYANKEAQIQHRYILSLLEQKFVANNLSKISPVSLYENVMSTLSGTDLSSVLYFVECMKTYRNKIIEYIRSKTHNFSTTSYFTTSDNHTWKELQELFTKSGPASNQSDGKNDMQKFATWREKKIAQNPPLNLQDFPETSFKPEYITKSVKRSIPDIFLLIIANALFLTLSFIAFLRYDVR